MKINNNSNEAMSLLYLCAMHMDGKVRMKELDLYHDLVSKLNIEEDTAANLVVSAEKDPVHYGKLAISSITDVTLRNSIYMTMSMIALIDGEYHIYEQVLLDEIKKVWGL